MVSSHPLGVAGAGSLAVSSMLHDNFMQRLAALLIPETALKAAQAALKACREFAEASQPGRPASGIRHRPGIAAVREDIEL